MLIMRFHKLIQSRVLWLIFLGIVIFTFVGLGVSSTGGGGGDEQSRQLRSQKVASIAGKKVTLGDMLISRQRISVPQGSNLDETELDTRALQRLARLRYAEQLGIDIPIEAAQDQYFLNFQNEDGSFNADMHALVKQQMESQGYTEQIWIETMQEQMTLQMLNQILASNVLIPPYEAERWAQEQTHKLTVEYAAVPESLLTKDVTVGDEELAAFFEENKEAFRVPEKRRIRYITVTAAQMKDQVPPVTEEEARARYEQRPEMFTKPVEKPDPEDPEKTITERVPQTFEEVKEGLIDTIASEKAMKLAEEKASDLGFEMIPTRRRPAKTLDTVAEENGLRISTPEPFGQMDLIPGVFNPFRLSRTTFGLDLSDLGKVSDPIVIGPQVLVAVLEEILPARLPELDEVREEVLSLATEEAQKEALIALGEEWVGKLRTQTDAGTPFPKAAADAGLDVREPEVFQPRDFNSGMPSLPPALLTDLSGKAVGEIYGPVTSRTGDILIGRLAARVPQPADTAELMAEIKNQLGFRFFLPALAERFETQKIDLLIEKDPEFFAPVEEEEATEESSDA